MNTVYPWQQACWQRLCNQKNQHQLGHAYLFVGQAGLGKQYFAQSFIQSLFCTAPNAQGYGCGQCQDCVLLANQSHPDFSAVALEEEAKAIKIEQIRALVNDSYQTAHRNGMKVILINPADKMNLAAANALLKTLEEPGPNTIFILIANQMASLPATVRSRCQTIHFEAPSEKSALIWLKETLPSLAKAEPGGFSASTLLKLAQGSPLKAKTLYESEEIKARAMWMQDWQNWMLGKIGLSDMVSTFQKAELASLLYHWSTWVGDLARMLAGGELDTLINADYASQLQSVAARCDSKEVHDYWQALCQARQGVLHFANLNETLLLEDLLLRGRRIIKHAS